jgi:methionyl-tRNA formyltransferase
MYFIGSGSLLNHAVAHVLSLGVDIDLVCCPIADPAISRLKSLNIKILESNDPTKDFLSYLSVNGGSLVFSINNKFILDESLLSIDATFINIHNGLVQNYRGIGEVCVFIALCNDEKSYGVTMHKIMPGEEVDSGPIFDQLNFGIHEHDDFSVVMKNSIQACRTIFEKNIRTIINGTYTLIPPKTLGPIYTYKNLSTVLDSADPKQLDKARNLGVFRNYLPRLSSILAANGL